MTEHDLYPGRLAVQQRVLPSYRMPFFSALARSCAGGLALYAGAPGRGESIEATGDFPGVYRGDPPGVNLVYGRNIYLFPWRIMLVWQPGLIRWLEAAQPEALIVEANPRNLSLPLAAAWMHARRRPVVGWGLGALAFTGLGAGLQEKQRQKLFQSFDAVIAYSARGAQEFWAAGIHGNKIYIAPNAVSPRPAEPPPEKSESYNGSPVVLFVGRLQKRKRVDLLMHACSALPESLQPCLRIVGDGPVREDLERLASRVYPKAQFAGPRHGTELDPFYREADLFVLPGTGGLAIQQAMANGLPVVVAEADGTQEDLVRPENGWCVSPGDVVELTITLANALSNPGRLRRMGKASYEIAAAEINLERMVSVFLQALEGAALHGSPAKGEREGIGEGTGHGPPRD